MATQTPRIPAIFETFDERFDCKGDDWWEHHFDDGRWTEGPVYVPAGRYLLFSDIPNNRTLRWDEPTNTVNVHEHDNNYANGRTLDEFGRVITCEQGTRRVVRREHDGSITVVADEYDGHRLNSPNDVVEDSSGAIWFTDPTYGIVNSYEGFAAPSEVDGNHLYRATAGGELHQMTTDVEQPNGLAFNRDESALYLVDSERDHIRVFTPNEDGLAGGDVLIDSPEGSLDGIRLDTRGYLWLTAGKSVYCYSPDGTPLGSIALPERTSNLSFGGAKRNRLFVTASSSLYSIMLTVQG